MVPTTHERSTSKKNLRLAIFLMLIFFVQNNSALFLEDSLIATKQSNSPIQYLQAGHTILSYDQKHNAIAVEPIKLLTTTSCNQIYALELEFVNDGSTSDQGILCAHPEQLFYNPINQRWIKAQDLTPNDF